MFRSIARALFNSGVVTVASWDTAGVWVLNAYRDGEYLSVDSVAHYPVPDSDKLGILSRAVRRALRRSARRKRVHVILPPFAGISFVTHLPRPYGNSDRAIRDHVAAYLELHDVTFKNRAQVSYELLEKGDTLAVSVTVLDKKILNEVTQLVRDAGYKAMPQLLGDTALSLVGRGSHAVLVSIGEKETTVFRFVDGRVVGTRAILVGTDQLESTLVRYCNLTHREAAHALSKYGLLQAHPDNAALSELFATLAAVFHAVEGFVKQSRMPYQHRVLTGVPERVLVVGPGALVPGLAHALSVRSQLPAEILSARDLAWDREVLPPLPPDRLAHLIPHLTVASHVLGAKFHKNKQS